MNNELLGPDSVDPMSLSLGEYNKKLKRCVSLLKACKMFGHQGEYSTSYGSHGQIPSEAPEGFITTNEKEKELKPMRLVGSSAECERCSSVSVVLSELETQLSHFVCLTCRKDDNEWDYKKRSNGISITTQSMIMEQPDSHYTNAQSGEGRN